MTTTTPVHTACYGSAPRPENHKNGSTKPNYPDTAPKTPSRSEPPATPTGEKRERPEKTANLPRLAVDVGEAAAMLGISRDFFDEHVRHELRWVRKGRLKLVAVGELEAWLDRSASRALDRNTG